MFELMPFERRNNSLLHYFDNLEREVFGNMDTAVSAIRTDIEEADDKYIIKAELPGFEKEDIHVDVEDGRLTISASHQEESEEKQKSYVRRERRYGSFQRSFDISGVDVGHIGAAYKNGILELTLPKEIPAEKPVTRVEIQ